MQKSRFVGRAGEKLDHALYKFKIKVKDKICGDFGSAIGGFVDCLLQQGAKKVYAVEKGYGVLDWRLRNDPRVIVMERTNAIHVALPEKVDLITIDTGWTPQEKIIPNALRQLKPKGAIISLIKPNYEASARKIKNGRLTEEEAEKVALETVEKLKKLGIRLKGIVRSPLFGDKAGNAEYLTYWLLN